MTPYFLNKFSLADVFLELENKEFFDKNTKYKIYNVFLEVNSEFKKNYSNSIQESPFLIGLVLKSFILKIDRLIKENENMKNESDV